MKNSLIDNKKMCYKAVILIHGYGSSGVGGSIKTAVAKCLNDNSLKVIVRTYVGGSNGISVKKSS
ncbi:MAG: hypothetical protein CVU87_07470 [Firmicutes bacterium HGW-Firmicutes-12]|nr:MAG: hypothetical protein CVU87_07470 [Firmicutes bacterium HGW-Firmicutes-12]